jgi:hypothetical protein
MNSPARPATWWPDPLNDSLLRYWDGSRWTFHTTARPSIASDSPKPPVAQPEPISALRPDIATALGKTRGKLVGSMKEVNLLSGYLEPEEQVLALCGAQDEGHGVLACTNHRLLFLFVGLLRKQLLQANWNEAKHIIYNRPTRILAVYSTKLTKHAVPAMAVRVNSEEDANTIAHAARTASSAPRLDIV